MGFPSNTTFSLGTCRDAISFSISLLFSYKAFIVLVFSIISTSIYSEERFEEKIEMELRGDPQRLLQKLGTSLEVLAFSEERRKDLRPYYSVSLRL